MKRSSSDFTSPSISPSPMSPDADIKPKLVDSQRDLSSPNNKGARANPSPNTKNSPKPKTKTKRSTGGSNGEWTPEKRERLIEILLAAGIKVLNMDDLARELGMTRVQISNATQAGRKGNLRYKAAKGVRGD